MKQLMAACLAVMLLGAALAGCFGDSSTPRDSDRPPSGQEESGESAQSETISESSAEEIVITPEYARDNNSNISEDDINLVQFQPPSPNAKTALIKTNQGEIRIVLFHEHAPKAVENFINLAQEGYYNGLAFYKVINNFLIEAGDPQETGRGGRSSFTGEDGDPVPFEDEFSLDLWHFRGAVSMANQGPDTNTSPFFIVQAPYVTEPTLDEKDEIHYPSSVQRMYEAKGGIPGFDWRYTIFGMVYAEDMEVVDVIASSGVDDNKKPESVIMIESVTIL